MKCIATVKLFQKIMSYARKLFSIKSSILLFSYFGIFCKSNTSGYHTKVKYIDTVLNQNVVGCVKGPIKRKSLKYSLVKLSQARRRYNYKEVVGKLIQILNDFFVSPRSRTRQAKVFGAILRTEVERERRNRQKRKESKRLEHKAGDIKVQSPF